MRRRQFLGGGLAGAAALALGPGFWRDALAARTRAVASAYGALGPPDALGLRLPPGFTARQIARANQPVPGTAYPWHIFSDGQATFPAPGGGWVLVSNSESLAPSGAGSSAIRFDPDGSIAAAYRILSGTNANCAGGGTPWGTWLSCEEHDYGVVWECDPSGPGQGRARPALGTFNHEAAAVDPVAQRVYLTEDRSDGGLYRFTPDAYPDLTGGLLEVAVDVPGGLAWARVPDPGALTTPTRRQVPNMRRFASGEGIWFDSGTVYFSTKGDNRIWAYDTATGGLTTIYDRAAAGPDAPLSGVDNLTVSRAGEVFVCEDGGNMEICVIAPDRTVAPFLQLTGEAAEGLPDRGNELAGVVFDPAGSRMYFAAQRAFGFGAVYEVTGPFAGSGAPPPAGTVSAPPGPAAPRAHGVRATAPARYSVAGLRSRGLPVRLELEGVRSVAVALRTDDLERVPGERGSTPRPRTVTLARKRAKGGARDVRLRLRIRARDAARLRARRASTARLTVVAQHEDGGTTVLVRRVKVVRGP